MKYEGDPKEATELIDQWLSTIPGDPLGVDALQYGEARPRAVTGMTIDKDEDGNMVATIHGYGSEQYVAKLPEGLTLTDLFASKILDDDDSALNGEVWINVEFDS